MVEELTNENFKEKIAEGVCLVDFWADWCNPCKMMAPVFEETSKDYEGKVKFFKVDSDQYQDIAQENGVKGIPCFILFNMGEKVGDIVGYHEKEEFKKKVDALMEKI